MSDGYQALHQGAALIDLSKRGRLQATGDDRARLLHALSTNHIQQLTPGQGAYAFFLTAQGKIVADAHLLCFPDFFLIDTEPETRSTLAAHMEHYIIADDVTVEDITDTSFSYGLEGPEAQSLLERLGATVPQDPESHAAWGDWTIARISATGVPGFRLFGLALSQQENAVFINQLIDAGAVSAMDSDIHRVRVERCQPRYSEDISSTTLPHQTGLTSALHFRKGCYLGQEIVERVRSQGQVNRVLSGLEILTGESVVPGDTITANGTETGKITSVDQAPEPGRIFAIAMLRVQSIQQGAELSVNGFPARVRAPAT